MAAIRGELISRKKRELIAENKKLQQQVEIAKAQLIALEIKNGKKQYTVPGVRNLSTDAKINGAPEVAEAAAPSNAINQETKQKGSKEKKPKKEKQPAAENKDAATELPIDVRICVLVKLSK